MDSVIPRFIVAAVGLILGGCVHTPPGTSVELALAKKAELIRLPEPPAPPPEALVHNPAVEPELPNSKVEMVADAFTRGQFCMKAGKDAEAIGAFEETVKLDPNFSEAWQNLAILYEKKGDAKKAIDAFKRSKKVAKG
jgi:tetratricopeptide (TPR) repeat protein